MTELFPHAARPCAECPFRLNVAPGQFPASRFDRLRESAGGPGREVALGAPIFACHKSPEGREFACAGWLAVCGYHHLGVRYAVVTGRLPEDTLTLGEGWPGLHTSYDEMVEAKGATSP